MTGARLVMAAVICAVAAIPAVAITLAPGRDRPSGRRPVRADADGAAAIGPCVPAL